MKADCAAGPRGRIAAVRALLLSKPVLACWLTLVAGAINARAQQPRPPDTAAAGAGAADTTPAAAGDTTAPEIEDVDITGVEALPEERVAAIVETRETECRSLLYALFCAIGDYDWAERKAFLDRAVLAADRERIREFYDVHGYPAAEVETRVLPRDDGDVAVRFTVREGRPIRVASIRVIGLDRLSPPVSIPPVLPLAVGDPYSLVQLEATREVIRRAFAERAHPFAEVEVRGEVEGAAANGGAVDSIMAARDRAVDDAAGPDTAMAGAVPAAARVAHVLLEAHPGPAAVFGEVSIQAEPPIEAEDVRERLAYRPGQPYRISALERTEAWLERMAIVERAAVGPAAESERDTTVRTRVAITAARERGIGIEGTVSSTDCVAVLGFWRNRYVFGEPRVLTLSAGVSNLFAEQAGGGFPCTSAGEGEFAELNYFVRADLLEPLEVDPYTVGIFGISLRRQSAPNTFIRRGYGARIGVARMLTDRLTATALYEPSRDDLAAANVFFCANYGVCEREGLDRFAAGHWLAPLSIRLFRGSRSRFGPFGPGDPRLPWRPALNPVRVWARFDMDLAHAWTASEFEYGRGLLESGLTRGLTDRIEVAGRVRLGALAAGEAVPPRVRLYSGGVNSVRGIPQNLLGPKVLVADPAKLDEFGCVPAPGGCPANVAVDPDEVRVRPLGGEFVLEANIEGRLRLTERLQFATFVDFGTITRDLTGSGGDLPFPVDPSTAVVTPGIGIRFGSGFGLLRVDVGYDPRESRIVPLFTEMNGAPIFLGPVTLARYGHEGRDGFDAFLDRLQLHVAIGQPF